MSAFLATVVMAWLAAAPPVAVSARVDAGNVTLQVPMAGTADAAFVAKLRDGLTHRVRYTLTLVDADTGELLLTEILTTEVVFDLWDERFVVTHAQNGALRRVRVNDAERVRTLVDAPRFRTLLPARILAGGRRARATVRADVNPISEEVLDRTRELLAPPVRDSESGAARSLLGNVARVFVNESTAGPQSRAVNVESSPFTLPPGGAP